MKAVLISTQPKWCELIACIRKKVEIRKTKPNIDVPFKCYIYQTKLKWVFDLLRKMGLSDLASKLALGKGKVIGEFMCNRIDEVYQCNSGWVAENACISRHEFFDYLGIPQGTHLGYDKKAYAWHISNLVIYDKPKELGEFFKIGHSEYRENEWKKRLELKERIDKYVRITGSNAHLNLDTEFEAILKMLSPFKMKRPPQSWCYVEEMKGA